MLTGRPSWTVPGAVTAYYLKESGHFGTQGQLALGGLAGQEVVVEELCPPLLWRAAFSLSLLLSLSLSLSFPETQQKLVGPHGLAPCACLASEALSLPVRGSPVAVPPVVAALAQRQP